jgi:hypothetical protein
MVSNRKIDKTYDNLAIYCQMGKHLHTHALYEREIAR